MVILSAFILVASLFLLAIICEDFFVESLDILSAKLKLPSDVAGATLMAVGSSAPELFTALFAVLLSSGQHADVGAGTIVGSAIFNILVIIGASAAFKKTKLTWQPVIRDLIFYILTILLLLWSFRDGQILFYESLAFLGIYVTYVFLVTQWKKILPYKDIDPMDIVTKEINQETKKYPLVKWTKKALTLIIPDPQKKKSAYLITFLMSIVAIAGLSYLLVESAINIGVFFRISPTIIALTVLAAGTSIPDLISSVIVAKQGRGDMAVSNAVGSNIFDILVGLGLPWMIAFGLGAQAITVGTENLLSSVFLLFATVVAILFVLITQKWTIGRKSGLILILFYIAYILYNIVKVI